MRLLTIALIIAGLAPRIAPAAPDKVAFAGLQEKCVDLPSIFSPKGKQSLPCHVTKGRWFATLDFLDQYQVQYCFGARSDRCDSRALLLFANRAYTPDAQLLVHRPGTGDTRYDDPLIVSTGGVRLMHLAAKSSAGVTNVYYVWRKPRWVAVDSQAWLGELAGRLPKGENVGDVAGIDLQTMTSRVVLRVPGGKKAIDVRLVLAGERFKLKSFAKAPIAG